MKKKTFFLDTLYSWHQVRSEGGHLVRPRRKLSVSDYFLLSFSVRLCLVCEGWHLPCEHHPDSGLGLNVPCLFINCLHLQLCIESVKVSQTGCLLLLPTWVDNQSYRKSLFVVIISKFTKITKFSEKKVNFDKSSFFMPNPPPWVCPEKIFLGGGEDCCSFWKLSPHVCLCLLSGDTCTWSQLNSELAVTASYNNTRAETTGGNRETITRQKSWYFIPRQF